MELHTPESWMELTRDRHTWSNRVTLTPSLFSVYSLCSQLRQTAQHNVFIHFNTSHWPHNHFSLSALSNHAPNLLTTLQLYSHRNDVGESRRFRNLAEHFVRKSRRDAGNCRHTTRNRSRVGGQAKYLLLEDRGGFFVASPHAHYGRSRKKVNSLD